MDIVQQFQNLFDPSTALGAFLISFIAGIVSSFFVGRKFQKEIDKKNYVEVHKVGEIIQDVHKQKNLDSKDEKVKKNNMIKAGTVTGTIKQDVEE
ncbi:MULTISPECIES: hypothetical protein [Clostridia]|jgi:hypothetical protein|uniref:hypothetical protein n=1 Tax=Clostridia TaxID=186801 RepID=UPI000E481131|nr:hypothetical protein [Clostridium sp. AM33-3]RHT05939.1 hypothetical protein DW884_17965 [Ruminococcus sp. AM40-10AC]RHT24600.1 hypothetical protein DW819_00415 [Clostridium sp. AM33-3]